MSAPSAIPTGDSSSHLAVAGGQGLLGAVGRPAGDRGRRVVPGRGERRPPVRARTAVGASGRAACAGRNPGESVAQARAGGPSAAGTADRSTRRRQSGKMAARAPYFPEGWLGGASDPREPCPLVRPVIQRWKRRVGIPAPLPHHADANVNRAGVVVHTVTFAVPGLRSATRIGWSFLDEDPYLQSGRSPRDPLRCIYR
jgi:hypothetical protein